MLGNQDQIPHFAGDSAAPALLRLIQAVALDAGTDPAVVQRLTLESSLQNECGIDSLARAELLSRIERELGRTLPEERAIQAERGKDLLAALELALPSDDWSAQTESAAGNGLLAPPQAAGSLVEVLEWHAARTPAREHLLLYDQAAASRSLTYGELLGEARAIASGLHLEGLEPEGRVALVLPTCREFFSSFLGILLAGGVPVPLYPPFSQSGLEQHAERHARIIENAGAKLLVVSAAEERLRYVVRASTPFKTKVLAAESLAANDPIATIPGIRTTAPALIQYTSGSTGSPKGVLLSHANLLANIRAMHTAVNATSDDVFVSWLPLYHDMGLIGAWLCNLYGGSKAVILPPQVFMARPYRWLQAIHRHRGTISAAPNFAYEICASRLPDERIARLDLSSWRAALNGAEPVHPETLERFARRFAPAGFRREALMPVYGLAECSVGVAFPPPGRGPRIDRVRRSTLQRDGVAEPVAEPVADGGSDAIEVVGCGFPLPGHQVRIVDAHQRELPERRVGALQFRGPSATSGYFDNEAANAKLFCGEWLESGDLAYIADGELFITGRQKDLIIKGGRNIYPQELEFELGKLPGIRKGCVAVFGVSDTAEGTEQIVAVAETREKDPEKKAALSARLQERATEVLGLPCDRIVLVAPRALPKTSSGKIRRAAARTLFTEHHFAERSSRWLDGSRLVVRLAGTTLRAKASALRELLYAFYCYLIFGMLFPAAWIAVVLLPGTVRARRKRAKAFAWALIRATRLPLTVSGREHLRPGIVASNHLSYLDSVILTAVLPVEYSFVVKRELQGHALAGPFLRALAVRFVERFDTAAGLSDYSAMQEAAKGGESLVYFPEGTFTREPGLRPFKLGAFMTAAQSGRPLLPVIICGTRSALRDVQLFPRRRPVEVQILPALEGRGSDWQAACELRDRVRVEMLRVCREPDLQPQQCLPTAPGTES